MPDSETQHSPRPAIHDLPSHLGPIDIYLLDQVLRGRIVRGQRIFDAGFGGGRNLVYFLREGFDVSGVDSDPEAVSRLRALASELGIDRPAERFRHEVLEAHSFSDACADVVISSAVLHFARDVEHFRAMLDGTWRVAAPGGLFVCRLASDIGMEGRFTPLTDGADRRYQLLDGSQRFLVDQPFLLDLVDELNGELLDPIKTTIVQDLRCMTTWVMRKPVSS